MMDKISRHCANAGAFILILIAQPAQAIQQFGLTVANVGVQPDQMYVRFTSPLTDNCIAGVLYLTVTTDYGKAAYSLLLTARASNKVVSRVDYTRGADGVCRIDLVEI